MSSQPSSRPDASTAEATATLIAALDRTVETVVAKASARTNQGREIDAHQPVAERVAYFATEVRAAKCLAEYASGEGSSEPYIGDMALVFAAEMASKAAGQLDVRTEPPAAEGSPPKVSPIAMPELVQQLARAREAEAAGRGRVASFLAELASV